MVNGPPTPPATTPVELQDEARVISSIPDPTSSANNPISAPLSSSSLPDTYQNALILMADAISRKDYSNLVDISEQTDITTSNDRQQSRLLIIAPLVLGHLILDELPPARHALLRLPETLASLPLSRALAALTTSTRERQHGVVHEQAAALNNLVSQADFPDKELASVISNLLVAFTERFRERTFSLLSKAYTSLPLALACAYLSWPPEQVVEGDFVALVQKLIKLIAHNPVAQKQSWLYDSSTQILSPGSASTPSLSKLPSKFSSLTTFGLVADSVARLEG